jgi:hypothetical protein
MYIHINMYVYIHLLFMNLYIHMYIYTYIYTFICIYLYIHVYTYIIYHTSPSFLRPLSLSASSESYVLTTVVLDMVSLLNRVYDDVHLRLQYGKRFHNLVYMSYVKHIHPACKA